MSPRAPLLLLALALATLARPAHAGRASACKAPPFAVPTETQRAVDAAIDARVTGTGAGAVSTGVETRTEYQATTLSQDAAARAWTEYTLCTKLAKKLISQELHDELLRTLIAPAVASSLPAETAPTAQIDAGVDVAAPQAPSLDQLTGTWQVVSRFQWSTCPAPSDTYGDYAYTWLIGTDATGALRVDVTGTTAFPAMTGHVHGGRIILEGTRGGTSTPTAAWTFAHPSGETSSLFGAATVDLALEGSKLVGSRDVVMYRDLRAGTAADPAVGVQLVPCVVRFDVSATR